VLIHLVLHGPSPLQANTAVGVIVEYSISQVEFSAWSVSLCCVFICLESEIKLFIIPCVGHCVGDPCEYGLVSLHVMPTSHCRQLQTLGIEFLRDAQLAFGLTAGFGSCVAQAYNQGMLCLGSVFHNSIECVNVILPGTDYADVSHYMLF
jgi:hypothetical protein